MATASYVRGNFLGGEISQFAQGRYDLPSYQISLNVCLNAFPVEVGSWTRRPGTQFAQTTRSGAPGRMINFDFEASNPYTMEFTDSHLRFFSGTTLVTTNDAVTITSISTANPAVVQTSAAVTWSTGDQAFFTLLLTSCPLLQNRVVILTKINTTHFSIADAITGTAIDGSTLGVAGLTANATINRVLDIATPYVGSAVWLGLRSVQTEQVSFIVGPAFQPYAVTVTAAPIGVLNATFNFGAALFNDGPYLDPFVNGVIATPNQTTGVIQITLQFPAYVATTSYAFGAFVSSAGNNYKSLIDQNVGNTPASSPSDWALTSAGAAINNGDGFLQTDIGRLVRLFSEPALWAAATTYAAGTVVSYNPNNIPGQTTYWQSLVGTNTGHVPGTDITNWQLLAQGGSSSPALWTWGKVVSLLNLIPSAPAGIAYVGSLTGGGGLSAAFNGVLSQTFAASANRQIVQTFGGGVISFTYANFVGQNFGGATPSSYAIGSVTVYPSSDLGYMQIITSNNIGLEIIALVTLYLYASNSPPSNYNNGTLIGTSQIGTITIIGNDSFIKTGPPVTIVSTDNTTSYQYVWVSLVAVVNSFGSGNTATVNGAISQMQAVAASTGGTSSAGCNISLLGPALLYNAQIRTWRFGAYSGTTGWPTCGTYSDGRVWLSGAINNRIDSCYANGITTSNAGTVVNFAPTDQYGNVTPANAISYTFNAPESSSIYWMEPDLQGIICGAKNGEWLITAPTTGGISPLNISARRVTKIGCANIAPRRTEHTTVFAQRFGLKLMEYFADVFSGKFSAPNLADKAQHVTHNGISEIAFVLSTTPIIWLRDTIGLLFGCTYKRDTLTTSQGPTFNGWHRHSLGSGRVIESISSGPSAGGTGGALAGTLDSITMVTNDTVSGVHHVEVLTDISDELSPLATAWYLDDAVNPTSVTTTNAVVGAAPYGGLTINGLWHLNGKAVQVFAGGLDLGDRGPGTTGFTDFVVSNGSIFVPYGDGISAGPGRGLFVATFATALPLSEIVIGFTFTSDGQLVRPNLPQDTGARTGPGFMKLRRTNWVGFQLSGAVSGSISFGTDFSSMIPIIFKHPNGPAYGPLEQFSGIYRSSPNDSDSFDSMICWRITRPFPANVVAVGAALETKDI